MKRVLTALLAVCLLCGLPVSAAERSSWTLRCRESRDGVELTLEGLKEELGAIQIELTLEGSCDTVRFEPAMRGAYSPECHVEAGRDETAVTIYLVAEGEALSGRSLRLGTLSAEERFALPGRGSVLALDRDLKPLNGGAIRVPLEEERTDREDEADEDGLYRIHITPLKHGAVTVRPTRAKAGEAVALTVAPEAGYQLDTISAEDQRGREVSLRRDGLNRYVFSMPEQDVEVSASFVPGGGLSFLDVVPGDWCYDAVRYVFEAGLMNGTSANAFSPGTATTRGQIVAILYRLEGSPAAGASQFQDVEPGAYYAEAVSWASANGIVNGYSDGTFRPGNRITREQMAAFLYRYARGKGRDVSDRAELRAFADAGEIASYAVEPVQWATAAGMLNGVTADRLDPGGNATRGQVAVILTRFVQNVF